MEQTANVQTPNAPLTSQEQVQVYLPADIWTNQYAQQVTTEDFNIWASYRQQNHDARFQTADQLYVGWCKQNTWEGTRIPRASIGLFLTMEQQQSLLARIRSSIFPLEDTVEAIAKFGTTPQQARLAFQLILQQLESEYCSAESEILRAAGQGVLYGNGLLEINWKYLEQVIKVAVPQWSESQNFDPLYQSIYGSAPKRRLVEKTIEMVTNVPLIKCIDIRDFYIDPNCSTPSITTPVIIRQLLTKEEIKEYAGQDGFDIPGDIVLKMMSEGKISTVGDQSKQTSESYRGASYQPTNDYTGDPSKKRIELLRRISKDRVVWLLNRNWVMYNQANHLGCINVLNAFYVPVEGRFYGLGIADVTEPEQRLQQSIINARIDELALSIHSPFVKKRGDQLPQGMMRLVPGRTIELDNPDQFKKIEWPNITQNAYMEVDYSGLRLQKSTGLTDIGAIGGAASGGNSANRTATGINTQVAVTNVRLGHIVSNMEKSLVEPMFSMIHKFNRMFLNPNQVLYLVGEQEPVDPLAVIHADVVFKSRGARKMQSRAMVLQMLPQLMPVLLNPSVMQLLAEQQGLTLDVYEMFASLCDALNVPETKWFRPMTQQEIQMQQQNNANTVKMQMQEQRLQAQTTHQQMKDDTSVMIKMLPEFVKNNPKLVEAATGYAPPKKEANGKPQ